MVRRIQAGTAPKISNLQSSMSARTLSGVFTQELDESEREEHHHHHHEKSPSEANLTRVHKSAFRAFLDRIFQEKVLTSIFLWAHLVDACYLLLVIPLRIGFFFDTFHPVSNHTTWNNSLLAFTSLDLFGILIRIGYLRTHLRRIGRQLLDSLLGCVVQRVHPKNSSMLTSLMGQTVLFSVPSMPSIKSEKRIEQSDLMSFRSQKAIKQSNGWFDLLVIIQCFPWEVLPIMTHHLNILHVIGSLRYYHVLIQTPQLWSDLNLLLTSFREYPLIRMLSFSTVTIIVQLILVGIYICHIAACGYMFIAHLECGLDFIQCPSTPLVPGSWVLKDHLEHGTLLRQYIRALYWGCKTVTTLGQGDVVPATTLETIYRVIIQFISGLWAMAILTAYSFYFSYKDTLMPTNMTTKMEQVTKVCFFFFFFLFS